MFLSKILTNKTTKINSKTFLYLQIQKALKQLYFTIKLLKKSQKNSHKIYQIINNYNKNLSKLKKLNCLQNSKLISYIITINMLPTNTMVNLLNSNGNLLLSLSAGHIQLKGKQKKKQPTVLILLLKELLLKANFINNTALTLHFKNTKFYHESLTISMLSEKFFVQFIKSYNLLPHNGCRPKKLKRLKNRG